MPAEPAPLHVILQQAGQIPLDVEITCNPGELLALVGPSGSGKTTVLRAIAGLYRPAAGRIVSGSQVWFDAAAGTMVSPQARATGLVFQDYALFPHLSALENVKLAVRHLDEPQRSAQAATLLARVHLDGLETRTPDQLSGGERQRVALARALARDPKVLLLDEPFSAVDRTTRERLKVELSSLHRSLEIPIILVTHDLQEAEALADRIAILHKGRTLQSGAPDDVRLRPVSALVARLMGQNNVLDGEVVQVSQSRSRGRIRWRERVLHAAATGRFTEGERVTWLIPADYVVLGDASPSADEGQEDTLPGKVANFTGLGEMTLLTVRLGADAADVLRLTIATRQARLLKPGSDVTIRLLAEGIHLMPAEN
ncbi:MAG: ABC transporter ATP-binding protein [Hyphomicrobium sp.]